LVVDVLAVQEGNLIMLKNMFITFITLMPSIDDGHILSNEYAI